MLRSTLYPRGGKQTLDIKVTQGENRQKWSAHLVGDYFDDLFHEDGGSLYLQSREVPEKVIYQNQEFWANSEKLALQVWGVRNPDDLEDTISLLEEMQETAKLLYEEYLEWWAKGLVDLWACRKQQKGLAMCIDPLD